MSFRVGAVQVQSRRLPLGLRTSWFGVRSRVAHRPGRNALEKSCGGCPGTAIVGYSVPRWTRFRRQRFGFPPIHRCPGGTCSPQPVPPLLLSPPGDVAPGTVSSRSGRSIRTGMRNGGQTCPCSRIDPSRRSGLPRGTGGLSGTRADDSDQPVRTERPSGVRHSVPGDKSRGACGRVRRSTVERSAAVLPRPSPYRHDPCTVTAPTVPSSPARESPRRRGPWPPPSSRSWQASWPTRP